MKLTHLTQTPNRRLSTLLTSGSTRSRGPLRAWPGSPSGDPTGILVSGSLPLYGHQNIALHYQIWHVVKSVKKVCDNITVVRSR